MAIPACHLVTLEFYLHSSPYRARAAFDDWNRKFHFRTMSVQVNSGSVGAARFRSGGHHYHAWHDDHWFLIVDVPDTVPDAPGLRAAILEQLGTSWSCRSH